MLWYFVSVLFLILGPLQAYEKCPWVDDMVWETVQPYLLPEDHPIKNSLDAIFHQSRVTSSIGTFKKAGFSVIPMINKIKVVGFHETLKGYVVKVFLDTYHYNVKEWKLWIQRIQGARQIQACLDSHGFNDIMKVPKKWIYPLPAQPMATLLAKNFILVAEDMSPLNEEKTKAKFKSISKRQMEALYIVMKENLLTDCIHIDNIPFSNDGKIAFIDTEQFNSTRHPVRFDRLTPYFSPYMQAYWLELIKNR